ncbi:MAG: hypothetical protein KC776_06485 [Myxococcales bacterium]|nr:hypothetical protein [Myxococcales bacterium]MCB9583657.1 hypothetical protein [Polyangiaceae bacterium]
MAMYWRSALALSAVFLVACGSDDASESTFDAGSGGSGGGSTGGTGGAITGGTGGTAGAAGSAGSAGSAGASCGNFGADAACQDCLKTKCCTEGAACEADQDCKGMVECARKCPDPTDTAGQCVQDCAVSNNNGGPAFNPAIICQGNECSMCSYL